MMLLTRLLFAILLVSFFSACGQPNARVEVNPLMVIVENLDENSWTDCRIILNASTGKDHQYTYAAGDIAGLKNVTVMLPQFTNADGKRFIPLMTKPTDIKIQCKNPPLPFSQTLTE